MNRRWTAPATISEGIKLTCGIAKDDVGRRLLQGGLPDCQSGGVATQSQQDESIVLCYDYFHAAFN